MVISELIKQIEAIISPHDTRLLITGILHITNTDYALNKDIKIAEEDAAELIDKAKRISSGEPLQYVVGSTEFMSLEFKVAPGVLIPRQDTETLVETVCNYISQNKSEVLDIGTGSGCVAISIAHYCKDSSVTSVDISSAALEIAKSNAKLHNASVDFLECDIMNSYPDKKFDLIVSNPPYIPTSHISTLDSTVKDYEPITALDGGKDGLDFYRRIINIGPMLLKPGGKLFFEVGYDQAPFVAELMNTSYKNIEIFSDLCGIQRVVSGQI